MIIILLLFTSILSSCQQYMPGFDFNLFKNSPVNRLSKAVENEDTARISELILKDNFILDYQEPKFGKSLLSLAVINNKHLAAKRLLELNADPNLRSPLDNSSPFLDACSNCTDLENSAKSLCMLIEYGADVNSIQIDSSHDQFGKENKLKRTALEIVCFYGNIECVKALVENGADLSVYPNNNRSIITTAFLGDNLDIVKYLLIKKNVPVPDYCLIRQSGGKYERKMTLTDLLNEHEYLNQPHNQRLKRELLQFLNEK